MGRQAAGEPFHAMPAAFAVPAVPAVYAVPIACLQGTCSRYACWAGLPCCDVLYFDFVRKHRPARILMLPACALAAPLQPGDSEWRFWRAWSLYNIHDFPPSNIYWAALPGQVWGVGDG